MVGFFVIIGVVILYCSINLIWESYESKKLPEFRIVKTTDLKDEDETSFSVQQKHGTHYNCKEKFKTKEDFVQFVKNAAKRKQEYIECRRNGATAEELKAKGFEALKVC